MNRLGWIIIFIIFSVIIWNYFIKQDTTFQNISVQSCSCDLDTILSPEYQKKIIQSIQDLHKEMKNPHEVIQKAVQEFTEISNMQAEICSADTICFHVQSAKPIFILNDQWVISDTQLSFKKENVDQEIIDILPKIYSKKDDEYEQMVTFIQQVPKDLSKSCTINWVDKNLIIFKPQAYQNLSCLVSYSLLPTVQLFQDCYQLHDQNLKKGLIKKNNKTMVEYDIRFKNQIIIKSGGKDGSCISFDYHSN